MSGLVNSSFNRRFFVLKCLFVQKSNAESQRPWRNETRAFVAPPPDFATAPSYFSQWRRGHEHSVDRYSFTDRPIVQVLDRYDDFHDNNQFHEMNDRVAQINAMHTLVLTVAREEARRGGLADYSMDDLEGLTVKQIQEAVNKSLQDRHKE